MADRKQLNREREKEKEREREQPIKVGVTFLLN